ncbi:recombinase family protein [Streptomyces sp. GQFP]|uniref:recombinase family protein n=1 Tax=Streptomyces sp. GQFP TaxID=2907545 RepID=UPI001F3E1DC0|nr:recombinase family protein [Streptomyces sp. GQFP]UIX33350.1 recombinase family protein [Streptomyces sp. GQFP]
MTDQERPLIYGYMRVQRSQTDEELLALEDGLRLFAASEGYRYATTFQEFTPGCNREFKSLIAELKRAGGHHVVVPTMDHLALHPLLQIHLLTKLELDAGAEVFEVISS